MPSDGRFVVPAALLLLAFGLSVMWAARDEITASHAFEYHGGHIVVTFHGEASHEEVFGPHAVWSIAPRTGEGSYEGAHLDRAPGWLSFQYSINGTRTELLVAKKPVMNHVSWDAIARAGAALGTDEPVVVSGRPYAQNARLRAVDGREFRVRLPRCGQSTMAQLSEWNLLIGGVHAGDPDFTGGAYGWLPEPYTDGDLMVGQAGSLTWCQDAWRGRPGYRVLRGYFHVSRFHAASSDLRTDRIVWRPVLELVQPEADAGGHTPGWDPAPGETSPHRDVTYFGMLDHEEVFETGWRLTDDVPLDAGVYIGDGTPSWLHFELEGRTLLVAASPVKHSLSWHAIARAGAALGDGTAVRVLGTSLPQQAEVSDRHGDRYRVRLLTCGESTMDPRSEWNRLIGGVHVGDGDFVASPDGRYG